MAYGQKNYLDIQGINGKYRIDQIGCFLTAFANLLERYGNSINPLQLNAVFRDRGVYIDVDDGVRDDLGWQSITAYNGQIVVRQVDNTGANAITSKDTIIRFTASNRFGTHFCLVDRIDNGVIYVIDSYDGVVKKASSIGKITGWASYANNTPQVVAPIKPVAPVAKPSNQPNYDGDSITVQPGWGISQCLKAAGFPNFADESEWQRVALLNGKSNWRNFGLNAGDRIKIGKYTPPITASPAPIQTDPNIITVVVQPGWGISHALKSVGYTYDQFSSVAMWDTVAKLNGYDSASMLKLTPGMQLKVPKIINPITPPAPSVAPPEAVTDETVIGVKVIPKPAPVDFRTTDSNFGAGKYIATEDIMVVDHSGKHAPLPLLKDKQVTIVRTFEKDGETYGRASKSVINDLWYGIPLELLDPVDEDELFNLSTIKETREMLGNLSIREKLIALLARIFAKFNKNKNKTEVK